MPERILSQRALNRALLARQLLLERSRLPIEEAVEQIGGLQAQYTPSGYVGLWTRLADFRRDELTRALEARVLVQATLMRATIHIVSRREFWRYAAGVREARRAWLTRVDRSADETAMQAAAERLREALAGGPRDAKELGDLGASFLGRIGVWVDLVRAPPSGRGSADAPTGSRWRRTGSGPVTPRTMRASPISCAHVCARSGPRPCAIWRPGRASPWPTRNGCRQLGARPLP